jgi:pyridine nucleotide-disulfide oxidoreductase domain-containing protein 1
VHDDDDDDVPTLVWLCKHPSIGDAFFDRDASDFLLNELQRRTSSSTTSTDEKKHSNDENIDLRDDGGRHKRRRTGMRSGPRGGGWVPTWTARLTSSSTQSKGSVLRGKRFRLRVVTDAHLARLERDGGIGGETFAVLGDGTRLRTDLLVSAAGVDPAPRLQWLPIEKFPRGVDGGLAVDGSQRTLGPHASSVFAAGDCASMEHRELSMHSGDGTVNQWFQMRLWSQARQAGTFAARVRVFFGYFWLFFVCFFLVFWLFGFLPTLFAHI